MAPRQTAIVVLTMGLLVIIVVLLFAMGGVLLTSRSIARTIIATSSQSSTATAPSKTGQTKTTIALCTLSGPTIGVTIRVLSNATSPAVGARISGYDIAHRDGLQQVDPLPPETTNSTGWASLTDGGEGPYYLVLTYLGQNYTLSVPTSPLALTYVVYYYASGNVTTHIRHYA